MTLTSYHLQQPSTASTTTSLSSSSASHSTKSTTSTHDNNNNKGSSNTTTHGLFDPDKYPEPTITTTTTATTKTTSKSRPSSAGVESESEQDIPKRSNNITTSSSSSTSNTNGPRIAESRSKWTVQEIAKFEEGIVLYGESHPLSIANHMGTRTSEQVRERIKTIKRKLGLAKGGPKSKKKEDNS